MDLVFETKEKRLSKLIGANMVPEDGARISIDDRHYIVLGHMWQLLTPEGGFIRIVVKEFAP